MRLYSGKIPFIAADLVQALTSGNDVEVSSADEVRLDLESVLKEYLRLEREVSDEAKRRLEIRGLGFAELGKVRGQVARERSLPNAEEALPYLVDQILHILFHSANVIEIYAEDMALRQKITPVLRKHMDVEDELDKEVRAKIRNLQEGTGAYDVEYAKVLEQIKRKHGLT